MVDVKCQLVIQRPRPLVAGFAADPGNAPQWYANIGSAVHRGGPTLGVGTMVDFAARFMGRELKYTYEVVQWVPESKLVMRTAQGPFPMQTTYTWTDEGTATRMVLANTGEPAGFSRVAGFLMAPMMRRAMAKDLRKLKELLESGVAER
ncbi:SRPBCC family protein [Paeniglutamicibacter sp. ABSL32-1]|uniref:SRPBCC family protein n=1 Tax=Paeniglutamicibacter quisquiliarum TaxID=2849498 RepID=UPI001C2D4F8E|nr:SRPBCC family protein [Paeniglutamicibacter quisquiliarum]MBV1779724.1 SRPBCC family protein [Paeniglutamicibacter quisquiliarum]